MPLTLYKRGTVWHYRGTVAGRRLRGSTGSEDKDTASRIAARAEETAWKCGLDGPASVLTFAQAAILYRKAGKSTQFLERVEDYWKNTLVRDITPGGVKSAAVACMPGVKPSSRNRAFIDVTRAVINHAAEMELCARLVVKNFPTEKKVKRPVTWEWVQAFMHHSSPHLGALACFMFLTGARVSEALAVTWGDVDLAESRALVKSTKVGLERWAHLPPPLIVALANIPGDRAGELQVFPYASRFSVNNPWRAACKRAGIAPLTVHSCRHGFATALLHAGVDPITVAKAGGWKTPQHVFETYGHAMDDATVTNRIIGSQLTQENKRA